MRDWGLLQGTAKRNVYAARQAVYTTTERGLELWLLACALKVHPAEELPLVDLLRLPELFAFRLTVGADVLRWSARFAIARQGSGWDAVRLRAWAGLKADARVLKKEIRHRDEYRIRLLLCDAWRELAAWVSKAETTRQERRPV